MVLEEEMIVSYKDMKGKIVFVCGEYATFTPNNSKALLLIYRDTWNTVTPVELSQTP
jgi:hypothetical protein